MTSNSYKKCKKFTNSSPNQPKAQILFDEKSSLKDFLRATLDIRVGVLFNTKWQFELMLLRSLMVDAYK